jgi:short-chain fatty acids transporter
MHKLGERFTDHFQRFMPDAFVFALILTLIVALTSFFWVDATPITILSGWYKGFWNLLEFGMQMVLLVITGYSIALSPLAKKGVTGLSNVISTPKQVYVFVMIIGSIFSLVSWSWIVLTAILARALAQKVHGINYPFLIALVYFSGGSWVVGLSSSIPLLLNTPGNYLIEQGILNETISTGITLGSSLNMAMLGLFLVLPAALFLVLSPKNSKGKELTDLLIDKTTEQETSIEEEAIGMKLPFKAASDSLNNSKVLQWIISAMGVAYIIYYFMKNGFDLNLNIMIFMFLMLGMILHQTPIRYGISMQRASGNVSGILFQFPFYAGIMGIMIHTGLGEQLARLMASVATLESFPFYVYLTGGIVNFAIPSGGGEFAVIGPSMISAVNEIAANLPPEELLAVQSRTVMAMAYGESLTNNLQPFFLLLILPVMGAGLNIQARDIMGYLVVPFVLFFVIQSAMVTWWPM